MNFTDWQPFETAPKEVDSVILATWGSHNFVGGYITVVKTEWGWKDILLHTRWFNEAGKNIDDNGYRLLKWVPIPKLHQSDYDISKLKTAA